MSGSSYRKYMKYDIATGPRCTLTLLNRFLLRQGRYVPESNCKWDSRWCATAPPIKSEDFNASISSRSIRDLEINENIKIEKKYQMVSFSRNFSKIEVFDSKNFECEFIYRNEQLRSEIHVTPGRNPRSIKIGWRFSKIFKSGLGFQNFIRSWSGPIQGFKLLLNRIGLEIQVWPSSFFSEKIPPYSTGPKSFRFSSFCSSPVTGLRSKTKI